jgi:hypothetical protein
LHGVGKEPPEIEKAVVDLVAAQPGLWQLYSTGLAALHLKIWEELHLIWVALERSIRMLHFCKAAWAAANRAIGTRNGLQLT